MKKREFTAEHKAKIVIEILEGVRTVSEIGARENISAKQLYNWKKEFLENSHRAFSQSRDEKEAKNQAKEALENEMHLMTKVGQLAVENDWLKKKYKEIHGVDRNGFKR